MIFIDLEYIPSINSIYLYFPLVKRKTAQINKLFTELIYFVLALMYFLFCVVLVGEYITAAILMYLKKRTLVSQPAVELG